MPGVYDDENNKGTNTLSSDDDSRTVSGGPKNDERSTDNDAPKSAKSDNKGPISRNDLNDLENNIGSLAKQGDDLKKEGLFNPSPVGSASNKLIGKLGSKISANPRRSAAIFGAGGGILIVTMFMFSMLSGPFQLLHFAQILSGIHFSDADVVSAQRLRNIMIYSKWAAGKDGAGVQNTRLGMVEAHRAGKIDDALAKSGLTSTFDKNGTFKGFEIDQGKMPDDIRSELKGLNNKTDPDGLRRKAVYAKHFEVSAQNIEFKDGKVNISVEGTRNNRKLYSKALKISGEYNKVTAAYNRRVLIKRANISYNPVTRIRESLKQNTMAKLEEFRENRRARLQGEAPDVPISDPDKTADDPDLKAENAKDADRYDAGRQEGVDTAKDVKSGKLTKTNLATKIGGGSAIIAVTMLCTVRTVSDDIADQQLGNKTEVARQAAAEVQAVTSKQVDGKDIDLLALSEITRSMDSRDAPENATDEQLNSGEYSQVKGSAFSASTVAKEQGRDVQGRTLDDAPELNLDEESNAQKFDGLFADIDKAIGTGKPLNVVCGAIDKFGEIASNILNIATLGAADAISKATVDKLADALFGYLVGETPDISAVKYAGIVFGEEASMGSRLMQNETNLANAQPVLSEDQALALASYTKEYNEYTDDRSIAQRIFNVNDYDTVAGKFANSLYTKPAITNVASLPSTMLSNITGAFGLSVKAEDVPVTYNDYYNVPKVGVPPGLLEISDLENPYDNAVKAKAAVAADSKLKEYVEKCNGITITDNLDFVSKSYADGVTDGYLKDDSPCKDDKFAMYTLPESLAYYTPINSNGSIGSRMSSILNKKTMAAPTVTSLSGSQLAYARVVMAATDTNIAKSYSCVYADDTQSCNEISQNASTANASAIAAKPGFKIMTFNVNSYIFDNDHKDHTWESRKPAIKSIIGANSPDIFGMQEAFDDKMYSDIKGMFPTYGITASSTPERKNPILFKPDLFTLVKHGSEAIGIGSEDSKAFTWAVLKHTSGGRVIVINAHLDSDNENYASQQADEIIAKIDKVNKDSDPVIVLGDFNTKFDEPTAKTSPVAKFIKEGFVNTRDDATEKVNADNKSFNGYKLPLADTCKNYCMIDYILVKDPRSAIDVNGFAVILETPGGVIASDHNPLLASMVFSGLGSPGAVSTEGWTWPLSKEDYVPITGCYAKPGHTGIDSSVGKGTAVLAARAGTVVEIGGPSGDGGNYIIIDHKNGYFSNYQHLSVISVTQGQTVTAGQVIGKSGGVKGDVGAGFSSGAHLHFSITTAQTLSSRTTGDSTVNPLPFLPKDRSLGTCK